MTAKRKEKYKKSKQNRMNHLKVQRKWYKTEEAKQTDHVVEGGAIEERTSGFVEGR